MVSFHPKIPFTLYYLLIYPKGRADRVDITNINCMWSSDGMVEISPSSFRNSEFEHLKIKKYYLYCKYPSCKMNSIIWKSKFSRDSVQISNIERKQTKLKRQRGQGGSAHACSNLLSSVPFIKYRDFDRII